MSSNEESVTNNVVLYDEHGTFVIETTFDPQGNAIKEYAVAYTDDTFFSELLGRDYPESDARWTVVSTHADRDDANDVANQLKQTHKVVWVSKCKEIESPVG